MVCVKQMDMKYDLVKGLMERDIGVKLQLYYLYYAHLKHREETKIHNIRESVSWFLFVCFFIKRPWKTIILTKYFLWDILSIIDLLSNLKE